MAYTNQISNLSISPYIVTGTQPGPFHTIQSAIDQAVADGVTTTIFVRAGTYTENLTLATGINIQGANSDDVAIIGVHVPPAAGLIAISQCQLSSATSILSSAVAGTADITIDSCLLNATSGSLFALANWSGDLSITNCSDISASNSISTNTGGSALTIKDSSIGSGATAMAVTGVTSIYNSRIFCAMAITGNAAVSIDGGSIIDGAITLATPATLEIYNSRVTSGAVACITTTSAGLTTLENVVLDSSAGTVIAGTGQIELGEVVFSDVKVIAGTITYANGSTLAASNVNVEHILFLAGSAGSVGQVLTSNGVAAPTWQAGGGAGFSWVAAPANTSFTVGSGVYNTKVALLTMTLPVTAAAGTVIAIQGTAVGAGGWVIAQNAGQNIQVGTVSSTIGVGGSIASTNANDGITLLCTVADTTWNEVGMVGNLTIV